MDQSNENPTAHLELDTMHFSNSNGFAQLVFFRQGWSQGHKARSQGQGHKKKFEAKDSPSEHRPSRGQGQKCSRPRPRTEDTGARVPPPQKKVFKIFFQAISKKRSLKNLSGDL